MPELKLVVLDCDGVMFDSREANRAYYGHLRARFGRPPLTEEEVAFVHAHSAPESVPHIFREWPGEIARVDAYRATVDYAPFLRLMAIEPDLVEFLAAVRPPLATAISTNRTTTMPAVLDTFGLRPHFDLVVTALDVAHPKPHPEALLRILAHFRLRAGEGLFIGDSQVDAEHAAAVGMPLIAFRSPDLAAAHHVSNFREVLRLPPFRRLAR
ncbi:MAG TPA: HAD family hydrolase [Candidatus Methanoperedens sp.]|nr:HAD family hydrolase [Candidatus Methanoperedens sp.]